jgi:hypothetical protein
VLFPVGKSETPTDRAEDLDSPGGATIDNHLEPDPVEQGAVVSWWLFGIGVALAGGDRGIGGDLLLPVPRRTQLVYRALGPARGPRIKKNPLPPQGVWKKSRGFDHRESWR